MNTLPVTITTPGSAERKIRIEVDADIFERLAANFGLFNPAFLDSLEQAERDVKEGKTRTITSLKELSTGDTSE